MYENKTAECYTKLKHLIQDQDISECSLLISKIKEYRHRKIGEKQIDKFDRLLKQYSGYHHSFGTFGGDTFLVDIPTIPTCRKTVLPVVQPLHPQHLQPQLQLLPHLFQHIQHLSPKTSES